MDFLLQHLGNEFVLSHLDSTGHVVQREILEPQQLTSRVRTLESQHQPRWIWSDTRRWYPHFLADAVRLTRCVDIRLATPLALTPADPQAPASQHELWSAMPEPDELELPLVEEALFATDYITGDAQRGGQPVIDPWEADAQAQWARLCAALAQNQSAVRRNLLIAAESAGALIAVELEFTGMPWDVAAHHEILVELLGEPNANGDVPAKLFALREQIRTALDDPQVNPDSPVDLLKRLRRNGLNVQSTSRWELKEINHPVIAPLLEYKRGSRLLSANGWKWLDQWVIGGRFRPHYVVGGVVTGRWATHGGGALQIPAQVRGAVQADPGWKLVVSDAAQLEPRVLAAMSGDEAMLEVTRAGDLYQAMVQRGAVETREQGKYGILGALYGGTTGESGRMLPRISAAFPRAMAMVEQAARRGEHNLPVSTWLGRRSPWPQGSVVPNPATERAQEARARAAGRFTRNFIVQGTAAEWAMSWMALLRQELRNLSQDGWFDAAPHLVYFLHDEVIVHTPAQLADQVAELVSQCAQQAGELLFPGIDVRFPVSGDVVTSYGQVP